MISIGQRVQRNGLTIDQKGIMGVDKLD